MCIKCHTTNLSINLDDLEPEFKRVAKLIYSGKLQTGQIDAAMTKKIAEQLLGSFWEGYGDGPAMAPSFIKQIEQNVFVFSGFKNYQQLKEASMLAIDEDGSYRNFNAWFRDIKQINGTYNEVYGRAEHANMLASAQAISNYNDLIEYGIEKVRFETAGDSRVRPEHALLNGTVVSINDPLFDKYSTPLDWGCRCEWVPAVDEDLTGWGDLPHVPPMFQTNMAKTGIIFPDTHPYFNVINGIAEKVTDQALTIMKAWKEESGFVPAKIKEYEQTLGVEVDKEVFEFLNKPTPLTNKGKGAYFNPNENSVNIPIDDRRKKSKWSAKSVVYHEYGHAADWQHGYKRMPELLDLMKDARRKYASKYLTLDTELNKRGLAAHLANDRDLSEKILATADTLMSLNPNYGFGHTKAYFKNPGFKEAEFIAHAFENRFIGNDVFKELMPDLYDDMIRLVDNVFKPKSNR